MKKIPKGLHKCEECGEYKGRVREKDLPTPDPEVGYETKGGMGFFKVSCLCDGIPCRICGKNKAHHPISNYYDPKDGNVLHVPAISLLLCAKCWRKKKK